jgi:hypothetical protein
METIAILCGISFKLKYTSSISDNLAHQIYPQLFITYSDMEVSCNGDTPKSSIKKKYKPSILGFPICGTPHLLRPSPFWSLLVFHRQTRPSRRSTSPEPGLGSQNAVLLSGGRFAIGGPHENVRKNVFIGL